MNTFPPCPKASTATPRTTPLSVGVEFRRSYARSNNYGFLKNISLTGAFLETVEPLDIAMNEKLAITLAVSGRERKVNAKIVWSNEKGYGIEFKPFNNRDIQIVDDLIYFIESERESRRKVLNQIFQKVA